MSTQFSTITSNLLITGLLLNEGQSWAAHRRFSLHHLRDLGLGKNSLESILLREVDAMVKHLDGLKGQPTPVNSLFNVHILNVLWEIITGKRWVARRRERLA